MKKLIITALFAITTANAQLRFIENEYFITSVAIDPTATFKEKSPNLCFELGLVSGWKYVSANLQVLPDLKGGYMDYGGSFGINLTSDYFDTARYYGGVRLGVIKRGYTEEQTYTYPLVGFEGGIDYNFKNSIFVGVKSTGDYRSDFQYSGADPKIRFSTFIKLGYKF